jgi:ParB family transcriptional regulator, chromosome partitioning protein
MLENNKENKKNRLGRGLGSLLSASLDAAPLNEESKSEASITAPIEPQSSGATEQQKVWQLPIEKLQPSKYQPRKTFEKEKLQELADSIKNQGLIQPILARKVNDSTFEIVAGERRWRAAQLAGLKEVPVIIRTLSHKETLELAIIENVQRENLNPLEEALAYQRLLTEFQLTQVQVAERVGKERATVTNILRLLALPQEVQNWIREGKISLGHAKVLLGLSDSVRIVRIAKSAIDQQLSVRALENYIRLDGSQKSPANVDQNAIHARELAKELQTILKTKVKIDYNLGRGKLIFQFYSDSELNHISEIVRRACKT